MKITDLRIDGFGVWNGLRLEQLPSAITVIYGPNEAGKSTLLQFMRTGLYGFSPQRKSRYVPPVNGGRPGGVLRAAAGEGALEIRRYADLPSGPHGSGDVEVIAPDGKRYGQPYLDQLMSGVDEQIFNNVFAVGLREIQELGTLHDTRAAEELYKLSSGLDRVSLFDVIRDLEASRKRILGDPGQSSELASLAREREKLLEEIQSHGDEAVRWSQMASRRTELVRELEALAAEDERLATQLRSAELALEVHGPWLERKRTDDQLKALGVLAPIPLGAFEQLEEIQKQTQRRTGQREQTAEQLKQLRGEAKIQSVNRPLWSSASKIEALGEMQSWLSSVRQQIERITSELGPAEAELVGRLEKMGYQGGAKLDSAPRVSPKTLSALRGPARLIRKMALKHRKAQEHHETCKTELQEIETQIDSALRQQDHPTISVAMETVAAQVAKLRRRISCEERLESLLRHREDMQLEIRVRGDRQILSPQTLLVIGGIFILGVMFTLSGLTGTSLLGLSSTASFALAILGLGGIASAIGIKALLETASSRRWDHCRDQLERLKVQIQRVTEERDELDRDLPQGGGPIVSRLHAAESELAMMEEMLPVEERRKVAAERAQEAEEHAARAEHGLRESHNRWRASLRQAGLHESLTPGQIRLLSGQSSHLGTMQSHLSSRREELVVHKREIDAFRERLLLMFEQVGLTPDHEEPEQQLKQLLLALAEQRKLVDRAKEIRRDFWREKRKLRAIDSSLDQLRAQRQSILHQAGASDEAALRERAKRLEQAAQHERRRDDLIRQIRTALGTQVSEADVVLELERHDRDHLLRRCDQLRTRHREVLAAQHDRHEQRGQLAAEMKALTENRTLQHAQLRLACAEQKIDEVARRWKTLAIAGRTLDVIRKSYESERQPEVLREASNILGQLTEGHYKRIWTPLGQQALRVDDREGRTLSLDVLSCGTRESVFLSLRLALISAYARRGAKLPVVLDDVLVNLDLRRATAAAQVLREFSRSGGHQLFVFTCHEHIVRIFQDLNCEVRTLPGVQPLAAAPVHVETTVQSAPVETEVRIAVAAPAVVEPVPAPAPLPLAATITEPVRVSRRRHPRPRLHVEAPRTRTVEVVETHVAPPQPVAEQPPVHFTPVIRPAPAPFVEPSPTPPLREETTWQHFTPVRRPVAAVERVFVPVPTPAPVPTPVTTLVPAPQVATHHREERFVAHYTPVMRPTPSVERVFVPVPTPTVERVFVPVPTPVPSPVPAPAAAAVPTIVLSPAAIAPQPASIRHWESQSALPRNSSWYYTPVLRPAAMGTTAQTATTVHVDPPLAAVADHGREYRVDTSHGGTGPRFLTSSPIVSAPVTAQRTTYRREDAQHHSSDGSGDHRRWYLKRSDQFSWDEPRIWDERDEEAA